MARARAAYPALPVEVEVRNLEELRQVLAIEPPVDRIMLDNMSLDDMRQAVALAAGRVPLEASGNVTLERVAAIAATGVDYISVGSLTHSAPALDLSMKVALPQSRSLGRQASLADLSARVAGLKAALGDRLVILGHHYQRDEVIAFADYQGDSLQLARDAAQTDAQFIVFCGVHFMAETAAILAKPGQQVVSPDPSAGCYLADTASLDGVQAAWDLLAAAVGDADAEFTPVTYVNSCGRAEGLLRPAWRPGLHLEQRRKGAPLGPGAAPARLLLPRSAPGAQHGQAAGHSAGGDAPVGYRTARPIRRPSARRGSSCGPAPATSTSASGPSMLQAVRRQFPGIRVLVHPECKMEVVDLADDVGSTAYIIRQVEAAAPGTQWAIGTESRLVERLQRRHPEQRIVSLADVPPFCRTMAQITLWNLAQVLEALARGEIANEITVDPETTRQARLAWSACSTCSLPFLLGGGDQGEGAVYALETDVLIIGSGIAGAAAALRLAQDRQRQVLVITRAARAEECNTHYAQGGIVGRGPGDSPDLLARDVLAAGAGLSLPAAVRLLAEEGPDLVQQRADRRAPASLSTATPTASWPTPARAATRCRASCTSAMPPAGPSSRRCSPACASCPTSPCAPA